MTKRSSTEPPVVVCPTWDAVLDGITAHYSGPSDPFVKDTLIVPSFGHGRYVAQHVSQRLGGPHGICAGIDMVTAEHFTRRLLGDDDPWQGVSLTLDIADALGELPGLQSSPASDPIGFAAYVNRIFDGYARHCPSMLLGWEDGHDLGPTGQPLPPSAAWQAMLWRQLVKRLDPSPHPARARLRAAELVPDLPGRLGVLLITPPAPIDQPLIHALMRRGAPVWSYRPAVDTVRTRYSADWPVALVTEPPVGPDDPAESLLHRVQADTRAGRPASGPRHPDGSIQIHASHGPSRQAEVLRDVMCSVFDEMPDLEPRDVLVLTTDPGTYGPLIADAFNPSSPHPAGKLRVGVASQRRNRLAAALADLLRLPATRAGADDLAAWCRRDLVARRFGFGPDDLDRLEDLIAGAGIVWGVDKAGRAAAGIDVRTGTWLDGVQRLIVSLTTDVHAASVMPVDGVQPEDADRVGALAEMVSRLRRAVLDMSAAAPLSVWADRLAQAADELFEPAPEEAWMVEELNSTLAGWRRTSSGIGLARCDVIGLLNPMLEANARPTFGNGTLQVRKLGELQGVAFRVTCVVGLDDATFPAPLFARADDLLFADGASNDARRRSRVALRDALLAARDVFIVLVRGADERTGALSPAPVAVLDLLEACGVSGSSGTWTPDGAEPSLVRRYPLQPYAWPAFAAGRDRPPSYDRVALKAAKSLTSVPAESAPGWRQFDSDGPPATLITLDDIESCLANPARYLLRKACGLSLGDSPGPGDANLPLALDSLGTWAAGQGLLDDLVAGLPPRQARARALGRPGVPPHPLGDASIDPLVAQAATLATAIRRLGEPDNVAVDLDVGQRRLTGAVPTRGRAVIVTRFGQLKAAQVLACWVRLLALAAQGPSEAGFTGHVWATKGRITLAAPEQPEALALLNGIADVVDKAARRLLPLPAETGAAFVGALNQWSADAESRAVEAFSGQYGEGNQAAWQVLLGQPTLQALRMAGRFDELSAWLWQPIIAARRASGEPKPRDVAP